MILRFLVAMLAIPAFAVVSGDDASSELTWSQDGVVDFFTLHTGEASNDYDQEFQYPGTERGPVTFSRPVFGVEGDTVTIFYALTSTDADGTSPFSNEESVDFPISDGIPPLAPVITITVAVREQDDLLGVDIALSGFTEDAVPDIMLITEGEIE